MRKSRVKFLRESMYDSEAYKGIPDDKIKYAFRKFKQWWSSLSIAEKEIQSRTDVNTYDHFILST